MRWLTRTGWAMAALLVLAVLALAVFRTPDTDPATMRAKYGAPPSRFVDLGEGLTVHLRDEGPRDALPIILLHGSNDDLHTWDAWAAGLSDDYRVIRYDTIGHGLTGGTADKDYSTSAMASVVGRVADKLELDDFVLVGSSMGGGVAATYALGHQERLAGLVLVDAAGAPRSSAVPVNLGFRIAATPGLNRIMTWITPRWIVEESMRQAVAVPAAVSPARIDRTWELLRYPGNREATRIRMTTPRAAFASAQLVSLDVPTLILWGERDAVLPVAGGRWFRDAISGSELIVYPSVGHLPMAEAARRSSADLRVWLAGLKPRKGP